MYISCITFFHQPEERGFPSTVPFRNFRPDSIHWTIMRRSYRTRNRIGIISECQFIHGRGSVVRPLPSGGHRKSSTARGGQRVVAPMAESGRSSSLSKHFANALWLSDATVMLGNITWEPSKCAPPFLALEWNNYVDERAFFCVFKKTNSGGMRGVTATASLLRNSWQEWDLLQLLGFPFSIHFPLLF